ncbi:MAG: SusC/RagA family TonB-linked outer membrane protein [Flavobacteriaceae bacterium]|nr:SusC/RagA family TonB-linked outer membrane protein [Flavobacteriaceae bacterium]
MKKNQFKAFLSALLFFVGVGVYAQSVSGTVTSEDGPLPGATVVVKGTTNGTTTDFDGNFTIAASADAILEVSFVGFTTQEVAVGGQDQITITLATDNELEEVVVTGYGSQRQKEITSAVVKVDAEDFNKGNINDASQLLQGKVAGLQVYNRGGDPNAAATIRLRGISTVGANAQPLVVVDGVIGASLANVDPSDIESINVLKDGSAAAIYGSRGSSGVILVTTKSGKEGKVQFNYNGQLGVTSALNTVDIMTAQEFVAAGGTNLGSDTDWVDEVTRQALTSIHNFSAAGGHGETSYRISANFRDVEGVLISSDFQQFNTRLNFTTKAFNDKLTINFNSALTKREQNNGSSESMKYAVLYNPTAPIYGVDSPYQFASEQFGGYFETLGLFDSYNPVSIANQQINQGDKTEVNYSVNLNYKVSDAITVNGNFANQVSKYSNKLYNPTTLLRGGNATSPLRKGLAEFYDQTYSFKLAELYGNYNANFGNTKLVLTAGYSFQQQNFEDHFMSLGDFPDNSLDYVNAIEYSQDLLNSGLIGANSNKSPDDRIIAFFGRANVTIDDAIFINASIRREGSTKLGADEQWGIFPAIGVGVDLNKYLNTGADKFKVRVGYGVTGALPGPNGLSQQIRNFTYSGGQGGGSSSPSRDANPTLKWEEKAETNLGIEYRRGKWDATLDLYTRDISDFILERTVDVTLYPTGRRYENAGKLNTKGVELALNYEVNDMYTTGLVLSSYSTTLDEYVLDAEMRGNLGAPGQNATAVVRVKEGEEIGQIWGPVFESVSGGNPVFADINNDGEVIAAQDKALEDNVDMQELGNGIPDLELGWTNQIAFGDWTINAFFRGAFGHSLVNTFRAFYEPRLSTQGSYNFVNTELAQEGLTTARFSSLYVEKADFFKLDNLTVTRNFDMSNSDAFDSIQVSLNAQNPLVFTSYTGLDPEPALIDIGENGGGADVLSPGLDRRNSYFAARSFTLGVNIKF